jgi:hypothetical protein
MPGVSPWGSRCLDLRMGAPIGQGNNTPEEILTNIGDIAISQHWVHTPAGSYPIRGTVWTVADMSHETERMSPVGIILAIVFIWLCFLSLIFLLIKERTVTGNFQVTLQGNGFHHSTLIPANRASMVQIQQQVNYARTLAALA